ncbi:MAG: peptide chain release factor N(5)-glutamine methyltransferase, partial [Ottowia sp.]|nr:peptide chain release factor N(5)-glutamine methyltransferase [Ottowia sp.]
MPAPSIDDALHAARAAGITLHEARMLLLHLLGRAGHERAWLLAHGSDAAPEGVPEALQQLAARRLAGEPIAYITGKKAFYGLELRVNEHTLDPRPDTETLVDWALELLREADAPAVLDLGCGSGAIALAIAAHCTAARVIATDASAEALAVARGNAERLQLAGEFRQGAWDNWFAPVADGERFQLIASNPPYIAEGDEHLPALHCEPRSALASGADGLLDIRRIIAGAPARLAPDGWLLLEHGWQQGEAVRALLRTAGFSDISTR